CPRGWRPAARRTAGREHGSETHASGRTSPGPRRAYAAAGHWGGPVQSCAGMARGLFLIAVTDGFTNDRRARGRRQPKYRPAFATMCCAVRVARVMTVICGGTATLVGNTLASQTKRLRTACVSPVALTTARVGLPPMRMVPCGW